MAANSRNALLGACAWAVATTFTVLFSDSVLLRAAMAAPLLLFLSGHVFLMAIGSPGTSPAGHAVYAVGASIAICLAGGFVLNLASRLNSTGWVIWLAAVTSGIAVLALCRRDGRGRDLPAIRLPNLTISQVTGLAIAALVTCGAYLLAVRDEASQKEYRYTEFWLLSGVAVAPGKLVIGISSGEARSERFDVEVTFDGQTIALWRSVVLDPGDTWTRDIAVAPAAGYSHKSEAWLYRPDDNAIYRRVSALIPGA
jgi:uncharacterized membrane protein